MGAVKFIRGDMGESTVKLESEIFVVLDSLELENDIQEVIEKHRI